VSGSKADQNPEDALVWLESYSDEAGYQDNLTRTVYTWIRKDPVGAASYIMDNYDPNVPSREISHLVSQWMQSNSEEATSWVSELPTNSIAQQQGITEIAIATANQDPVAAFNLVKDLPDQRLRNHAVLMIARTWAAKDPDGIDSIAEVLGLGPKTTANLKSDYRGKR